MTLTWRQIAAYLELSDQLDRVERAKDLLIAATGAQGNEQAFKAALKEVGPLA